MGWLTRCLPRTIFWRLAWLTATILVLSLSFVFALAHHSRMQIIASQVAEQSAERLAAIEDALDELNPDEQQHWLEINQAPYSPHLLPASTALPPNSQSPKGQLARDIGKALQAKIPGLGAIFEDPQRRQIWAMVSLLGKPYWLVIPPRHTRSEPGRDLALFTSVFGLAALLVAALTAWRINRPLRELGLAAKQLGQGEYPKPLPEKGPLEVAELSKSFNRMLADLATTERERNLMLAGVSHDLRTPLARLRLGVEMMHDESLRPGMVEDVEDIERILGQFIDFARGLGDEAPQACDPASLLTEIAARFARSGCAITLQPGENLHACHLRPLALQRALSNLIDNARRYGKAPISLAAHLEAEQLIFAVSDCGPGIAPDQLAQAMQPFHRLDSARRADGGSGLGLAIVERIAKLHGGRLVLSNRAEGGLLASLQIPSGPP